MTYYIVGIKGAGCCALANILHGLGEEVCGCDSSQDFYTTEKLTQLNYETFEEVKLDKNYFYIIGNAYHNHPLTKRIISEGYRYKYYPEFIQSYFKVPKIGICGSHGKSTTTSFITQMTDIKINALIGDGTGYGFKDGRYLVMEACEYKRNFLKYDYEYLVVLNIDYDHPDYFKNEIDYENAFKEVSKKAKCLITNYDDENCRKIRHKNMITFGFYNDADMVIRIVANKLSLTYKNQVYFFDVPFAAKGYIYDFAAAFLMSMLISENLAKLKENSCFLKFPKRRMNIYIDKEKNNIYIDDYAHHPTEIKNVVEEVKSRYKDKEIIVIFQPHTYTRSIAFYKDFKTAFWNVDKVYIASTFASVREVKSVGLMDENFGYPMYDDNIKNELLNSRNVVIMFVGAGDIGDEIPFFINNKKDY